MLLPWLENSLELVAVLIESLRYFMMASEELGIRKAWTKLPQLLAIAKEQARNNPDLDRDRESTDSFVSWMICRASVVYSYPESESTLRHGQCVQP